MSKTLGSREGGTGSQLRYRVGFCIEAQDAKDALARIGEAEDAGVRQVWMTDGGANQADVLSTYAAAAQQTSNLIFGTAIVPVYPRHPLTLARQVIALNDLAPGRLRLGVGVSHRSDIEGEYGIAMGKPLEYLREYVGVLRMALWQGRVDFRGTYFASKMKFRRTAKVPILIAALRERAFALAGEISDGAIAWMCPVPYLLERCVPALKAGALSAGRPPPPLVAEIMVALGSGVTSATNLARERVEAYSSAMPFYASMFEDAGMPVTAGGDGARRLANHLLVAGEPDSVRESLRKLLHAGIDELLVSMLPVADEKSERKALLSLLGSM